MKPLFTPILSEIPIISRNCINYRDVKEHDLSGFCRHSFLPFFFRGEGTATRRLYIYSFNSIKGKDTRGYPYQGCLPAAECKFLRVYMYFDEGGKPEYREKNPQRPIEIG